MLACIAHHSMHSPASMAELLHACRQEGSQQQAEVAHDWGPEQPQEPLMFDQQVHRSNGMTELLRACRQESSQQQAQVAHDWEPEQAQERPRSASLTRNGSVGEGDFLALMQQVLPAVTGSSKSCWQCMQMWPLSSPGSKVLEAG